MRSSLQSKTASELATELPYLALWRQVLVRRTVEYDNAHVTVYAIEKMCKLVEKCRFETRVAESKALMTVFGSCWWCHTHNVPAFPIEIDPMVSLLSLRFGNSRWMSHRFSKGCILKRIQHAETLRKLNKSTVFWAFPVPQVQQIIIERVISEVTLFCQPCWKMTKQ